MNIICYMHILQTVIWDSHEDVKEDTYTNLQLLLQRLFLNSARAAFHDSQFRNDPYLPFTRPRHSLSVHHLPETSYSFQPPSTSLYVCFYWFSHLTRIDLDSSQVWLLCFILIWLWGDHTSAITDITQSQGQINKKKRRKNWVRERSEISELWLFGTQELLGTHWLIIRNHVCMSIYVTEHVYDI